MDGVPSLIAWARRLHATRDKWVARAAGELAVNLSVRTSPVYCWSALRELKNIIVTLRKLRATTVHRKFPVL